MEGYGFQRGWGRVEISHKGKKGEAFLKDPCLRDVS